VRRKKVQDDIHSERLLALVRRVAADGSLLRERPAEARVQIVGGQGEGAAQVERIAIPGRVDQFCAEADPVQICRQGRGQAE
jgi:hypothetical protein